MPEVTVKAFSELIHTPLYGQLRILNEQKYPQQAPGIFKIQYYRPALSAIRRFYRTGNNLAVLPTDPNQVTGVGQQEHQRENNFRAITAFRNGGQTVRTLTMHDSQTWELTLANVTMRCTPDLAFIEKGNQGYILLDCRKQSPEIEIIRTTLELFHRTLGENGVQIPMRRVEYIHLETNTLHRWNTPRQTTINRANQTAAAIQTLWDSI
jgi:hypothetical protein